MRIAALQHDIAWEDRETNLARLTPQVDQAVGAGARLVVLTEMFATGFSMSTDRTAEDRDGPIVTWLTDQATRHGVWVAGSLALRDPDRELPLNALCLVSPDGDLHRYDKLHPFTYAGEHERFAAGDRFVTVDVEGLRVTLFVCYDLRFADEFWATARDTDVYLVGEGGQLRYVGDSRIVDPLGEVLVSAAGTETILLADLDPQVVRDARERLPFLPDRRTG
jgi:predicted amidohydrolase